MTTDERSPEHEDEHRNDRGGEPDDEHIELLTQLVSTSFGSQASITDITDAGEGRGVFSQVRRVGLAGAPVETAIAKLTAGSNSIAAIAGGAVSREKLAYTDLLPIPGVATPTLYGIIDHDLIGHDAFDHDAVDQSGASSFLLEDLATCRRVDQLDGLPIADTLAAVEALAAVHQHFEASPPTALRRATPSTFPHAALAAGHAALSARWGYDTAVTGPFGEMLDHRAALVDRFGELDATLCHGDPRADNLVFAPDGSVVLFDWQQIAVQAGEADVAWLLATSLEPSTRAEVLPQAIERYAARRSRSIEHVTEQLRTSWILPGLSVLFLAQLQADTPRTEQFIRTSIERISAALADSGLF